MECTLQPFKCDFAANFISYLGRLISRAGIKVTLSKMTSFLMPKMSEFEIILSLITDPPKATLEHI